jgi:hypothetical protein
VAADLRPGVAALGGVRVSQLEVWDTPMGGPVTAWRLVATVPFSGSPSA